MYQALPRRQLTKPPGHTGETQPNVLEVKIETDPHMEGATSVATSSPPHSKRNAEPICDGTAEGEDQDDEEHTKEHNGHATRDHNSHVMAQNNESVPNKHEHEAPSTERHAHIRTQRNSQENEPQTTHDPNATQRAGRNAKDKTRPTAHQRWPITQRILYWHKKRLPYLSQYFPTTFTNTPPSTTSHAAHFHKRRKAKQEYATRTHASHPHATAAHTPRTTPNNNNENSPNGRIAKAQYQNTP
jgi:hypothetical protein